MSKYYNQPVQMKMNGNTPAAFFFRDRWRFIVTIDRVQVRRDYLDPHIYQDTYRATLQDGGVCDLVDTRDGWVLERMWD